MICSKRRLGAFLLFSLLFSFAVLANSPDDEDDYSTDAQARVARIRFLDGDAQIKRVDSEEWEIATLNLPLVEGDEIQTGPDGRLELQFDINTYLRIDEGSFVKITSLGDEGVAVSISSGTLLISVLDFDSDKGYLEVDAPQTTVAITQQGKYRIDAGSDYDRKVNVAVWDGGLARVYTLDSGFTLKNEQSASMELEGSYAGKWAVARNSGSRDDFDDWSASRDEQINDSLNDSYYGRYYDRDLYGADDLNDYGSWQYNDDYGYVWSPYGSSVSRYANWSPYRYGHWRWLPYYGWTWVNDEPWGWATYHYGRWIYLNGRWFWTPYSYNAYYRSRRSWWRPAIVYISYIGNNICWYPLPYGYNYYDYNRRYRNNWRRDRRDRRNNGNNNPPAGNPSTPSDANVARNQRSRTPPLQRVPTSAVITAKPDVFGTGRKTFDTAPLDVSRKVLSKVPSNSETPPILPDWNRIDVNRSPDIIALDRKGPAESRDVKIGAADRKAGEPLDQKLREKKIYGNRPPLTTVPRVRSGVETNRDQPGTGVFDRRAPRTEPDRSAVDETRRSGTPPLNRTPANRPPETGNTPPVRPQQPKQEERKPSPPVYTPTPKQDDRRPSPPVSNTPKREERRPSPPVYNPPPRRSAPPSSSPPPRRSQPAPRTETKRPSPPPAKSTPKQENKPAPKPPVSSKGKDS